jgi:hypothetical protein
LTSSSVASAAVAIPHHYADGLALALGDTLAEPEALGLAEALGLSEGDPDALGDTLGEPDALGEAEAEGETDALGDALALTVVIVGVCHRPSASTTRIPPARIITMLPLP